MRIVQEKYIVCGISTILTLKDFKRYFGNPSQDMKRVQIRLFNSRSEAQNYVETRYGSRFRIVKVMVTIEEVEEYEDNE